MYSLIGFVNNEFTYDNYKDLVSIAKDQPGINNGLTLCGNRIHEITDSAGNPVTSDFIELEEVNIVTRKIKYGTTDTSNVGVHTFTLKVYLEDTVNIVDNSA